MCVRVHAVNGALVSEENQVRMLAAWMGQQGCSETRFSSGFNQPSLAK